jgi:hypothetical protein
VSLLHSLSDTIGDFVHSAPGMPEALVYVVVASVPVTLLHALGHAAVASRRLGVHMPVGSTGEILRAHLRRLRLSVGALATPGGVERPDVSRATARNVMLVALAGPAASLLGVALAASALSFAAAGSALHDVLWACTLSGLCGAVLNLVPLEYHERRGGSSVRTDGRLALEAARALRSLR